MTRFVLEGYWTGYSSRQSRVVHREIISKDRAERLKGLREIVYTDGTSLIVSVREAAYRERVDTDHSYIDLIRDAEKHGGSIVRVAELSDAA